MDKKTVAVQTAQKTTGTKVQVTITKWVRFPDGSVAIKENSDLAFDNKGNSLD